MLFAFATIAIIPIEACRRRVHQIIDVRLYIQMSRTAASQSRPVGGGLDANPEPECQRRGLSVAMSKQAIDRVWDIIEKVGVGVLTTQFAGGLRARPLEARPDRDAGLIWFVTDLRSGKEHEIEAEHYVGLVFIDAKAKAYLSITARAEVRRDHAKAAEIWKRTDNMWWNGPDDPNVCVLRVRP